MATITPCMNILNKIKRGNSTHDCPECKEPTYCAVEDGKSINACWCYSIPTSDLAIDEDRECLCSKCLSTEIEIAKAL